MFKKLLRKVTNSGWFGESMYALGLLYYKVKHFIRIKVLRKKGIDEHDPFIY